MCLSVARPGSPLSRLLLFLSFAISCSWTASVNRTIDDYNGDAATGFFPMYSTGWIRCPDDRGCCGEASAGSAVDGDVYLQRCPRERHQRGHRYAEVSRHSYLCIRPQPVHRFHTHELGCNVGLTRATRVLFRGRGRPLQCSDVLEKRFGQHESHPHHRA
ncbi:hypothetical protein B0H14DRAFT_2969539, partial [Mycena olivaceomarginata]